jgi:phosphoglycolate phosphatase/pyrophosphatase PpaX
VEFEIWRSFTASRTPRFFPGFLQTLAEFRERGGRIAVISHSEPEVIRGHYRAAGSLLPDVIYGWHDEERKRKPSPWPVEQTLRDLGLAAPQALVLDDLKPGVLMALEAGVPVAGAGWAHQIREIRDYMRANCLAYFETVQAFRDFLLGDGERS